MITSIRMALPGKQLIAIIEGLLYIRATSAETLWLPMSFYRLRELLQQSVVSNELSKEYNKRRGCLINKTRWISHKTKRRDVFNISVDAWSSLFYWYSQQSGIWISKPSFLNLYHIFQVYKWTVGDAGSKLEFTLYPKLISLTENSYIEFSQESAVIENVTSKLLQASDLVKVQTHGVVSITLNCPDINVETLPFWFYYRDTIKGE